jgi:tetratricopeptide (TPR) repeat protein
MDQTNSSELDRERIEQIRGHLSELETDALLEEWKENNREEWTDEAFEAIRQILVSRLGADLPPQADHEACETQLEQAMFSIEMEELEKALEELSIAIRLDPFNAKAHHLRGLVLEDLDDLEGAIKSYQEAVRVNPDYKVARSDLRRAIGRCKHMEINDQLSDDQEPVMSIE